MLNIDNNSIINIFDDNNSSYNLDEEDKENFECFSTQEIYPINNMLLPYIDKNNKIGEELLQTCGCSKEILKVFPFQNEKELVDYEEELSEEKALFQIKNEI